MPVPLPTVHRVLADLGPMTLHALAALTGHSQARLRTHVRAHRDAYANAVITQQGVKLRIWYVCGEIK